MITKEDYANAIVKLINVARLDCGASCTCAQVLLSAYNGDAYQLNITELCNLDADLYAYAMVVIMGRVELRREPHEFIKNGAEIFNDLWKQWINYHVKNRYKKAGR